MVALHLREKQVEACPATDSDSTATLPPVRCTIEYSVARPSPVPPRSDLVVNRCSKMCSSASVGDAAALIDNADPEAYRLEARALALLSLSLADECGVQVDSIDLGGGFGSKNTLQLQYLAGDEVSPSLGQYADKIAEGLADGLEGREPPRIRHAVVALECDDSHR